MSSINYQVVADRLTVSQLRSFLQTTGGDIEAAIDLYDWNTRVGAALHEDLGRLEVLFAIGSTMRSSDTARLEDGRMPGIGVCNCSQANMRPKPEWTSPTRDPARQTQRGARQGHRRTRVRILAIPVRAPVLDIAAGARLCATPIRK